MVGEPGSQEQVAGLRYRVEVATDTDQARQTESDIRTLPGDLLIMSQVGIRVKTNSSVTN